jgi:hypothetical protein
MYVEDVENNGTTKRTADPKVLREEKDMNMPLLQKKKTLQNKEDMCTWLL